MSGAFRRRDVVRTLWMSGAAAAARPRWAEALAAVAHEHAHVRPSVPAAVDWAPRVLDARQNDTVIALTEAIVPETDTPGARAALVNRFVDQVLADADPKDREAFLRGLAWLDARCEQRAGAPFAACAARQQADTLEEISGEGPHPPDLQDGVELFRAAKELTILGYYSSEIGLRQELGDDGTVAFAEFPGCDHPEHGAPRPKTT